MAHETSRRDLLKGTLAIAGLSVLGIPEWAIPALAQGETLVPFTDIPPNHSLSRPPSTGEHSISGRSTGRSRPRINSSRPSTTAIPSSIRRRFA